MNSPTEAVYKVRRAEHRRLARKGDYRLAGSRNLWLTGQQRLTESRKERFENACGDHLENRECLACKELLRDFWGRPDARSGTEVIRDWHRRVVHTLLTPMRKVAAIVRERLACVDSCCIHGATNAVAETINARSCQANGDLEAIKIARI
jgi:transposase